MVTAGVHTLTPGQKVRLYEAPPAATPAAAGSADRGARAWQPQASPRAVAPERRQAGASRFNISRWALEHPALTRYLMVVLMVLGVAAYFQLGQDEDPPFTFRAMVVQAFWPGASAQQMAEQVTDKIEKTLQEVPYADKIRSYTKPGESLTILQLADSSPAKEVANSWYQARKRVGDMRSTLPAGVVGPVFNDDFGDVYGSIFALSADGFTPEELRVFAERVRQRLLRVPDVAKVEIFGAQAEKVFVEISQKRLAQLGPGHEPGHRADRRAERGRGRRRAERRQREPAGARGRPVQLGRRAAALPDPRRQPGHRRGQHAAAGRHRRGPARLCRPAGGDGAPPGQGRSSRWACRWPRAATSSTLGKAPAGRGGQASRPTCRVGITLEQMQDQPRAVSRSVGEFVSVLIEAVVIVLAVSFISLGLHTKPLRIDIWPGLVVGITIPLVLAITFVTMYYWGVGLHKISLGTPDHRARPARRRRDHRGRDDGAQARGGLRQDARRHLRLRA